MVDTHIVPWLCEDFPLGSCDPGGYGNCIYAEFNTYGVLCVIFTVSELLRKNVLCSHFDLIFGKM